MRQKIVIANWKMNGDKASAARLVAHFKSRINTQAIVAVCPPFVYLQQLQKLLEGSAIMLGAQNVNANTKGAFTGEISIPMLEEFGCKYVLVGHSERRSLFGETDQVVAEKFAAVCASDMTPVLCVGETEQERESDLTEQVILRQLDSAIAQTGIAVFAGAVVAYEPVWAIGTGKTASPEQAQSVHALIRERIASHDQSIGQKLPVLYGGSVKSGNAGELFAKPDIDGGLVGGASLDGDEFAAICLTAG